MSRVLAALTVPLLVTFLNAGLALLITFLRLLEWTIRTYGWRRVGTFGAALWLSLWLHRQSGPLPLEGIALITLLGWAALLAGFAGLRAVGAHLLPRVLRSRTATGGHTPLRETASPPARHRTPARPASGGHTAPRETASSPRLPLAWKTAWEEMLAPATLQAAWQRVWERAGAPGPDGMTVEQFAVEAACHLQDLAADLVSGTYRPQAPRWVAIPKPTGGRRRLAILTVRDRVVQQALHLTLAPRWNPRFAGCSYAYRPGQSARKALAAVEAGLAAGNVWVVDADIAAFFDSVPHDRLFRLLRDWLPEPRLARLVTLGVTATSPTPGRGLAQGAPLSPLLANLYLDRFDAVMVGAGHRLIRYADDFVLLCPTRPLAEHALRQAAALLQGLGLALNHEKTRIVHRDAGFTFLGYTFDRAGKRPSAEAVSALRHRLAQVANAESRRRILAGWRAYFGDPEGEPAPAPSPGGPPADVASAPARLAAYRRWFVGRPDVFARHWRRAGRSGYVPVRRPLSDAALQAHLSGQAVLGTYLLHPEGTTRALVFDIDGPAADAAGRRQAFQAAHALVARLARLGVPPLWIDTGGKGCHLWLCFSTPVPAARLRQWARDWLESVRPLPDGVCVEVFPKQERLAPGALGSLIRLPFGRHPTTGRWSALLDTDGRPVADAWASLAQTAFVPADQGPWAGEPAGGLPAPPAEVAPLVQGCALIAALIAKAARTRHLRHAERLSLLYTLGPCGEAGRAYLHQVIGLCTNYDPRITERWIRRLEPGRRAIRCATLREWVKDYLPGVTCPCLPGKPNPSPLDLLARPHPAPAAPAEDDLWEAVAADLFDRPPEEDDAHPLSHPSGP